MQIVIDIPEDMYNGIINNRRPLGCIAEMLDAIKNGTPFEKHDEEVIKETVESIWGKPPYTELLDKIKAEIEEQKKECGFDDMFEYITGLDDALYIIDEYAESEDEQT